MARQTAWLLALALACVPALDAAAGERPQQDRSEKSRDGGKNDKTQRASPPSDRERGKWWLYDRAELGISDQQSSEINQIFESTLPKLRDSRHELERAEEQFSRTLKEHKADITAVSLLLDRVENARSQHNKIRTLMLYRMHLLLTAEQRSKLEALRARRDAERRDKEQAPGRRRHP